MKKLLSLAMAGAAIVALNLPADAKPERGGRGGGRGGGGMAQAQARGQAAMQHAPRAQAPRAAMQSQGRARASANVQNRAAINQRAAMNQRARVAPENRAVARERVGMENRRTVDRTNRTVRRGQPNVAFGGQNRRDFDRSEVRRDFRDRDFGRGERFRRPPVNTWRNWDRGRVYSWDNHRWHWYNGAWAIVGASPYISYYDYDYNEPYTTTYASTSGSTVAAVQRELASQGYSPGPIDGVMGGATRSAIAAFQRDNGLAVTGNINATLLNELDLR